MTTRRTRARGTRRGCARWAFRVVVAAAGDAEDVARAAQARVDEEAAARERYARGEASMDVSGLRELPVRLGMRT
jgi:hypothetical protein